SGSADEWKAASPRAELRPQFSRNPKGGPAKSGSFVVQADKREGLDGYWTRAFPITGNTYYRFKALRKTSNVGSPRRSAVERIIWQDDRGHSVLTDEPLVSTVLKGAPPIAEPEYPAELPVQANGWTEISGLYRAPAKATRAIVELHLQWAPKGRVEWSEI